MTYAVGLSLGLAVLGCGDEDSCSDAAQAPGLGCADEAVVQCLRRTPSIATGAYGCASSSDDVGPPEPQHAAAGFVLDAFDDEPPPTPDDGLTPVASATTDSAGFFELALAPGPHWLCTSFRRCMAIDVVNGEAQAHNYDFGPAMGFW